jgi:hypothetical protein
MFSIRNKLALFFTGAGLLIFFIGGAFQSSGYRIF